MKKVFLAYILCVVSLITISQNKHNDKINGKLSVNANLKLDHHLKSLIIDINKRDIIKKKLSNFPTVNKRLHTFKKDYYIDIDNRSIKVISQTEKQFGIDNFSGFKPTKVIEFDEYNVYIGWIKIDEIEDFAAQEGLIYSEIITRPKLLLNECAADCNAPNVWNGNIEVPGLINGEGVYIGVIDDKPLRNHITFNDENGETRWVSSFSNNNPNDHGTHVAGIAGGYGNSSKVFRGIAYGSNLIWEGDVTSGSNTIPELLIDIIAVAGNNPLVVNCSAGHTLGPHDGTDIITQTIDNTISNNQGAIFIAAAGNNGDFMSHLQGSVEQNGNNEFSIKIPQGDDNIFKIEIWYSGEYSLDVRVSSACNNNNPQYKDWVLFGNDEFFDLTGDGYVHVYNDGTTYRPYDISEENQVIFLDYYDDPFCNQIESGDYYIELRDHNNDNSSVCVFDAYHDHNSETINFQYIEFNNGDYEQSIINPGYGSNVITVGATIKQSDAWFYTGDQVSTDYSSRGPSRTDNANECSKPDIVATGGEFLAVSGFPDQGYIASASETNPSQFDNYMQGTSMSAPMVTGAVALLKQNFPDLTASQVKEILQESASPNPNGHSYGDRTMTIEEWRTWGAGNLDILAAYKYMVGYTPQGWLSAFKNSYTTLGIDPLPIEEVNKQWNGIFKQKFTDGAMVHDPPSNDAFWMGEEIFQKWDQIGNIDSDVGFATSSQYEDNNNNNYPTVDFEDGCIYYNGTDTIVVIYYAKLYNHSVQPSHGTTDDSFVFSIYYKDNSGDSPNSIKIYIGNNAYSMTPTGSNYEDGVEYTKSLSFNAPDNYHYYFEAETSNGDYIRYPETDYLELNVGECIAGWEAEIYSINVSPNYLLNGGDVIVVTAVHNNSNSSDKIYYNLAYTCQLFSPTGNLLETENGTIPVINQLQIVNVNESFSLPNTNGSYSINFTIYPQKDNNWGNNTDSDAVIVGQDGPTHQFFIDGDEAGVILGNPPYPQCHPFNNDNYCIHNISGTYVEISQNGGSQKKIYINDFREYNSGDVAIICEWVNTVGNEYAGMSFGEQNPDYVTFVQTEISCFPGDEVIFEANCAQNEFSTSDPDFYKNSYIEGWFDDVDVTNGGNTAYYEFDVPGDADMDEHEFFIGCELSDDDEYFLRKLIINVIAPLPTINSINQTNISADDILIITGNNFSNSGTVKFGDIQATTVNSWNNSSISCVVPEGIENANVLVINNGGASNGISYLVISNSGDPEVVQPVPDQSMYGGTALIVADCNNAFWDPNNDDLAYNVQYNSTNITHNQDFTSSGLLEITSGDSISENIEIILTATDEDNATIYDTFNLNVINAPIITVTPYSYDFGEVAPDSCSSSKTFVLKNIGGDIASGNISMSGEDTSDFLITSGSGSFNLLKNQTKEIIIEFCPESSGSKSANLSIVCNSCSNNKQIPLFGTGHLTNSYTISGYVNDTSGNPVNQVYVIFSNSDTTITNTEGLYSCNVVSGYTGTAIPVKTGWTFVPSNRSYQNVSSNHLNENYTGVENINLCESLQHYYKYDGDLTDCINGINGVNHSTMDDTNGIINHAREFISENNTYVDTQSESDFNYLHNGSDFTISVWEKHNPLIDEGYTIIGNSIGIDRRGAFLSVNKGKVGFSVGRYPPYPVASFNWENVLDTTATQWNHLVITYQDSLNNDQYRLYVNGLLSDSGSRTNLCTTGNSYYSMKFGINKTVGEKHPFDGSLDEMAFWNRALEPNEVWALYNNGNGLQYPFIPSNQSVSNISVSDGQNQCYDATNTITIAGNNTTVEIQSGGEASFIAGEKILFKPGFKAFSGSYVNAQITTTGNYCSNQVNLLSAPVNEDEYYAKLPEIFNEKEPTKEVKIYPNPTNGLFNIDFNYVKTNADITVYNFQGRKMVSITVHNQIRTVLDITGYSKGIYLVLIKINNRTIVKRIVKN